MEHNENNLKQGSLTRTGGIIMAVCGAAPAMSVGGSLGTILGQTKGGAVLAVIAATLVLVFVGFSYGTLASRYNSCGGMYAYIGAVFGPKAGRWAGFTHIGMLIATGGTAPVIFARHLSDLFPGIPVWLGLIFFLTAILIVSWNGLEVSTTVLAAGWLLQTILLLVPALCILGSGKVDFQIESGLSNAFCPGNGLRGFVLASLTWVWAYIGFETPAYMGEEMKGGARDAAFAIPASAVLIGAMYVVCSGIWVLGLNGETMQQMANSSSPLADYCNALGFGFCAKLVDIAIMIACFAAHVSISQVMSRFLYDMGRKGDFPKTLAKLNKKRIPWNATLLYFAGSLIGTVYSLVGNGKYMAGMEDVLIVLSISSLLGYAFICAGSIKESFAAQGLWEKIIAGRLFPVLAIGIIGYMIFFQTGIKYLIITAVWSLLGVVYARRKR